MRKINYIIIHCTGTSPKATVKSIQDGWKKLGWKVGGYHYLIEEDGTIHKLYPLSQVTNGVAGFNSHSIHISYIGGTIDGKNKDTRTEAQKESILACLKEIYDILDEYQDTEDILIRGHRDFSPDKNKDGELQAHEWVKDCPCFDVLKEYWWIQGSQAINKGRVILNNNN